MNEKRKFTFLGLLLLWAAMVGCSRNEWAEEEQNPNNAIQFGVSAGKQTRAPVVDNISIREKDFGLYAYYTGQELWSEYAASNAAGYTPNFMNNQQVHYNDISSVWAYTPLKYWPNTSGDRISFFAYWPYSSSSSVEVNAAAGSLPAITFTQSTSATDMVDFIVAHKLDMLKQTDVVMLPFKHVLTRLNFSAKIDHGIGAASETTVYVTGLKILGGTTSALYEKATYQLDSESGTWDYGTGTKVSDAIDVSPIFAPQGTADPANKWLAANTGKSVPLAKDGDLTPLLEKDEYAFLIPPHGKEGIKTESDILVELAYSIVTEDASLTYTGGYSETTTTATISLPEGILKEGKAYNICFTIGLSEVKLSAYVYDWEQEEHVDAPSVSATVEAEGKEAEAIIKAWQTLNTGAKKQDADVNYFFIKIPAGAPTGDLDLSTANGIYNFDEGDRVELQYNDLGTIQGELKLPDGWVWDKASNGANVLYKNSPKGYYLSDDANIEPDDNNHIMILDKDVTKEQLDALAEKFLGASIGTTRNADATVQKYGVTMYYLEVLPDEGFKGCANLASLFLPRLKELGSNTFEGCTALEELKMSTVNELEKAGTNWFGTKTDFTDGKLTVIIGQCAEASGITVDAENGKITVSGETYTFQEGNVSCPGLDNEAGVSDGGMSAGGADWGDGGDITVSNNKSTNP